MRRPLYICGLGNPGFQYESTRHNLGFETIDLLAARIGAGWKMSHEEAAVARGAIGGFEVKLLKPLTYVNASGTILDQFEDLSSNNFLVVCDDINLLLGNIRIRGSGGSGGHKGLESIESYFESRLFPRLRMGIGPPPQPAFWKDFVLQPFSDKERDVVERMKREAVEAIEAVVTDGVDEAMQSYNSKT